MSRGRASTLNTPNRFERFQHEPIEVDLECEESSPRVPTTFFRDSSKSILASNESPDVPFTYSVNPYRGCEHGCIYCYARPSHEYLGFSAGLDFESKIMVKTDAATLLEKALLQRGWKPQVIALSGNTDCYQPAERKLGITRGCLEVLLRHRNPAYIITKNALVLRDLSVLQKMAGLNLIRVMISITTLRLELSRTMEPRTSTPDKKLQAIEQLSTAGIPVGVMVAPVIPGLTDEEIPDILRAAREHGAGSAGYILLRLPGAVRELFQTWLRKNIPDRAAKVIGRIMDTRSGELSDHRFHTRMKGEGEIAKTVRDLFLLSARKCGYPSEWPALSTSHFISHLDVQEELFPFRPDPS